MPPTAGSPGGSAPGPLKAIRTPSARHLADKRRSAGPDFAARKEKPHRHGSENQNSRPAHRRRTPRTSRIGVRIPETREFPLVDAAHIRAAEAYFRYAPDDRKAALARRILARAREMGVDVRSRVIRGWAGEA